MGVRHPGILMTMELIELFQRMGVALGVGVIVGLERGFSQRAAPRGAHIAGLRTFTLVGVLGGACGVVAFVLPEGAAIFLGLAFAAVAVASTWMRIKEAELTDDVGATTLTAMLVVFVLGVLAIIGDLAVAAAGGVATAVVLSLKQRSEALLERFSSGEIASILQLGVMTAVVLPLLPNARMGPFDAWNPRELWLLVILIAAVSFAGYVAIRVFGERRGVVAAGVAGGVASSTAATLSLSRAAKGAGRGGAIFAAGAGLACAMSFARVGLIAGFLAPALWPLIGPSMAAGALATAAMSALFLRGFAASVAIPTRNPLELAEALRFGAIIAAVMVLGRGAQEMLGDAGLVAFGALSGVADVDAVTLSYARMAAGGEALAPVALGILAAALANTAVKAGLAAIAGGRAHGLRMAAILGVGAAAAVAAYWAAARFMPGVGG